MNEDEINEILSEAEELIDLFVSVGDFPTVSGDFGQYKTVSPEVWMCVRAMLIGIGVKCQRDFNRTGF